jgi:hypothetical protein
MAVYAQLNNSSPMKRISGLEQVNLITPDDCLNYSQIYPIFNLMIINYDHVLTLSEESSE